MAVVILFVVLAIVCGAVAVKIYLNSYDPDSGNVIERAGDIAGKYSTKMGSFAAEHEGNKSLARTGTAIVLAGEARAVAALHDTRAETEASQFNALHNWGRLERQEELSKASHELEIKLIGEASQLGLDVPSYTEIKRKLELDRLELQKNWEDAQQQLKAGFIYQMQGHQHLSLLTEYIGKLYDRAEELRQQGKERELNLIEEHISFMESDFRGRQRLLQAGNGQDVQGSDTDTES